MKAMPSRGKWVVPVSRRVVTLVSLVALGLAGCGDDKPSSGSGDTTPFVGDWTVAEGSFTCAGLNPVSLNGEQVTVATAGDGSVQATVRGCTVKFDVSGREATARVPQTCMVSVTGLPAPVTLTVTSGTFVVTAGPDGGSTTGVLNLGGTAIGTCQATANVNKTS